MNKSERIERRLKLHDLRVLMAVVEQGSMGKAAERLATSQPAVSRAISDLEHSLGVRLLDRGPRGIVPSLTTTAALRRFFCPCLAHTPAHKPRVRVRALRAMRHSSHRESAPTR